MGALVPLDEKEKEGWSQATKAVTMTGNVPPPPQLPPEVVQDFAEARENLAELSQVAMQSVKEAAIFASQAQNDKIYNSLASLIRAANETQRDRMDVHDRHKKLMPREEGPRQVTNNQTLVMTSQELLKLIRQGEKQ